MVVKESNSPPLKSKIARRVNDVEYKFEYFDQTELKSIVVIMAQQFSDLEMVCMANMISPKVGLTAAKFER